MIKIISALVVGSSIALSGYFIGHGLVESRQYLRFVEVKGLAEKTVESNEAIWTINIKLVDNELPALYQAIEDAQNKTKQFLIKQGFNAADIVTKSVSVADNQSYSYNDKANVPRYSADTGIVLTTHRVHDVAKALQQTGELVQQGIVVTNSSVIYRYTLLNQIKPTMLNEASQSAFTAAQSFAKNTQGKLGNIRHASQGSFSISDANSNYDSGDAMMKKIRVVTTIEYELK